MSVYGVWTRNKYAERVYVMLSKVLPFILTGITIGLEYVPAIQRNWTTYMFVANAQATTACTLSIILILVILWKYVGSQNSWRKDRTGHLCGNYSISWKVLDPRRWKPGNSGPTPGRTFGGRYRTSRTILHGNWLVPRLSIAIVLIS